MPTYKISQLTTATAVSATNQFEINQNSASRSATLAQIATYARGTASDVVVLPAGTSAATAISPTGDPNTGLIFPAAETIAGIVNGTETLRLDSTGLVQIKGAFGRGAPVTRTANVSVVAFNQNWIICNGSGTITITLPDASQWIGRELMIKTIAAQSVLTSPPTIPITGGSAADELLPATDGAWATIVSDGTNWIVMQRG